MFPHQTKSLNECAKTAKTVKKKTTTGNEMEYEKQSSSISHLTGTNYPMKRGREKEIGREKDGAKINWMKPGKKYQQIKNITMESTSTNGDQMNTKKKEEEDPHMPIRFVYMLVCLCVY